MEAEARGLQAASQPALHSKAYTHLDKIFISMSNKSWLLCPRLLYSIHHYQITSCCCWNIANTLSPTGFILAIHQVKTALSLDINIISFKFLLQLFISDWWLFGRHIENISFYPILFLAAFIPRLALSCSYPLPRRASLYRNFTLLTNSVNAGRTMSQVNCMHSI